MRKHSVFWISVVLLLFFNFSFLFKTDLSFSQDLGRHIKSGQIILETGQVAGINQFSYTYSDYPFINHHWLFQVIVALAERTIGIDAFLWVKIIILLIASFLTLKIIPKGKQVWILSLGFIFFHILRERTELRPEILSFLFTSLTLYLLLYFKDKKDPRYLYALPLIELIWTNMHIYFPMGLILQGVFLSTFLIKKEIKAVKVLGLIFILSMLLTLINPNFILGALYPFQILSGYGYTIAENQTMFLLESLSFSNPNFLFVKLGLGLGALGILGSIFKRKFDLLLFGLIGLGSVFALLNTRSFPYLVFLSFPALIRLLPNLKESNWWVMINILVGVILLGESLFYLNGDYYRYRDEGLKVELKTEQPGKKALDFILEKNLPQPIFNNFDIGSYITYRAYPKYKVFVDGRPEAYPNDFFKQIYIPMQEDPKKFISETSKTGIKTVVFSVTDQTPWASQFFKNMNQNADWKMVYLDEAIVVYVKSREVEKLGLKTIDLKNLKVGDYNAKRFKSVAMKSQSDYNFKDYLSYLKISYFLINIDEPKKAQEFAEKGLSLFKYSPMGNMIMLQLLSQDAYNSGQVSQVDIDRYYLNSKNSFWW